MFACFNVLMLGRGFEACASTLKHLNDLILLKKKYKNKIRCLMCYVIQRTDIDRFQPSIIDPEYRKTFIEAVKNGVEIITLVIKWTLDGNAYFITDNLPVL